MFVKNMSIILILELIRVFTCENNKNNRLISFIVTILISALLVQIVNSNKNIRLPLINTNYIINQLICVYVAKVDLIHKL